MLIYIDSSTLWVSVISNHTTSSTSVTESLDHICFQIAVEMPTDLIFYVVDKAFVINRYLCSTPLGWDSSERRFTYDNRHPSKFFWWYFTIFILLLGVTGGSCGYVVYGYFASARQDVCMYWLSYLWRVLPFLFWVLVKAR